ncbi:hypothetical protein C8J57DRAFT_1469258 [Mycena rebaudengoi]|nr:hypothetical protein C8J57DRAFT_1469258 [Mycena rebaudengoi]
MSHQFFLADFFKLSMSSCHPALELNMLAGLHWRIRARALAVGTGGNSEEFQAMVRLVETDAEARKFLLPVFYAGLDTQPIGLLLEGLHRSCCFDDEYCINCSESLERRDSRRYYNLLSENLNRVVWCMRAVFLLTTFDSIPSLAVPDLWSRIWPWIQFGDTYRDNLPYLKVVAEMDGYHRIFFTAMVLLHRIARRDSSDCVFETPGLPQFVVSMWDSALREPSFLPETSFSELCLHIGAHLERHFDDAIDGASGRTGLALLVVKQIDFIYNHPYDAKNIAGLSSLLSALLDKILTDRRLQDALTGQARRTINCHLRAELQPSSNRHASEYKNAITIRTSRRTSATWRHIQRESPTIYCANADLMTVGRKPGRQPTGQQSRAQTADADDEGEGDSVGGQDSDEDVELSDAGSIASFISNDDSGSDDDEDGMADHAAGDEDNQQDGDWDGTAQFAAAYDIDMNENDDEQQIFGDGSSDSD